MGRWVTSKGRRIYIPDPGEENPYVKSSLNDKNFGISKRNGKYVASSSSKMNGVKDVESQFDTQEEAEKHILTKMKQNSWTWDNQNPEDKARAEKYDKMVKDYETKQKQIAENKRQADERNGKKSDEDWAEELVDSKDYVGNKSIKGQLENALRGTEGADSIKINDFSVVTNYKGGQYGGVEVDYRVGFKENGKMRYEERTDTIANLVVRNKRRKK